MQWKTLVSYVCCRNCYGKLCIWRPNTKTYKVYKVYKVFVLPSKLKQIRQCLHTSVHTHSHTHTHTHTHAHTHTHVHTHAHMHTCTHNITLSNIDSLSLSHTLVHTPSISVSQACSHTQYTHTHTHIHTHSHSHTCTHTHKLRNNFYTKKAQKEIKNIQATSFIFNSLLAHINIILQTSNEYYFFRESIKSWCFLMNHFPFKFNFDFLVQFH